MFSFFSILKVNNDQSNMLRQFIYGSLIGLIRSPIPNWGHYLEKKAYSYFGKEIESQTITMLNKMNLSTQLCTGISAAILEEIFFRGTLMFYTEKGLKNIGVDPSTAKVSSEICAAILFSWAHEPGNRIRTFCSGILYGELANSFGLVCAMSAHLVNNTLAIAKPHKYLWQLMQKLRSPIQETQNYRL